MVLSVLDMLLSDVCCMNLLRAVDSRKDDVGESLIYPYRDTRTPACEDVWDSWAGLGAAPGGSWGRQLIRPAGRAPASGLSVLRVLSAKLPSPWRE